MKHTDNYRLRLPERRISPPDPADIEDLYFNAEIIDGEMERIETKKLQTKKFITIVSVLAWLLLTLYMLVIAPFVAVVNMELLQIVWSGFTGFMALIVGFYFGKSTALEMPKTSKTVEYVQDINTPVANVNKTREEIREIVSEEKQL